MTETQRRFFDTSRKFRQSVRPGYFLIVEDDYCIASFLKNIIKQHGHPAAIVRRADSALQMIEKDADNIKGVIVDLHLYGGGRGEDVIEAIENGYSQLPYFIYTSDIHAAEAIARQYRRAAIIEKASSVLNLLDALGFNHGRTYSCVG